MAEKKEELTLEEKLNKVRIEMKVGKNRYNNYGKYKYRNAESILEAAKPILDKYGLFMHITNEIVTHGSPEHERFYMKSTASIWDAKDPNRRIISTVEVREDEIKKGMDGSQISGTSLSYANKYVMGDMFFLDDTKDADSTECKDETDAHIAEQEAEEKRMAEQAKKPIGKNRATALTKTLNEWNIDPKFVLSFLHVSTMETLTEKQMSWIVTHKDKLISEQEAANGKDNEAV